MTKRKFDAKEGKEGKIEKRKGGEEREVFRMVDGCITVEKTEGQSNNIIKMKNKGGIVCQKKFIILN